MKTFKIQHKEGIEPFQAFGLNEAKQLFRQWAIANGIVPVIIAVFN